ncbi:unnamed protein product [Cuscuta campestris]|uniref:BUB1 N-terminal domain-containing protein n=1 Tax=Cuscuta campestris TaxID=132261 RepID=A0A484MUA7_9ASTE|nr:unnamed protein product [Cuscuta campestris]
MENAGEGVAAAMDPESHFLASKQETGNEWELFKENVRPLKRGRNVRLLNHALKSNYDFHLKNSLLRQRRRLIEAIDEYNGEDPLHPWLECMKWVQESFPPGGDSSGLVVIYEQCVRKFWHDDRYKDDLRYLKVWLEYAENCADAEVIYRFLEANEIGLSHSSFYLAYALLMESKNKIRTANEIFNCGISINAQPIEKLKEAYRTFLSRSMGRPKEAEEDPTENQLQVRSFGTLLSKGATGNQATDSSGVSIKKMKHGKPHGALLPIYNDTNASNTTSRHHVEKSKLDSKSPWHCLGARGERNKENLAIPSKWTSNKIPQKTAHRNSRATAPSIEVFVDEECKETNKAENQGEVSTLHLRHGDGKDTKKETELLRENPLHYFPASSLPR